MLLLTTLLNEASFYSVVGIKNFMAKAKNMTVDA